MTNWAFRVHNWQEDAANNIGITAPRHDGEDDNIYLMLNRAWDTAGVNAPITTLNMNNQKFINAQAGSNATDFAIMSQVQSSVLSYALATGTAGAFIVALTPAATSYTTGMVVRFKSNHTPTGVTTVNVNGLGAKSIKKSTSLATEAGDIITDQLVTLIYDGTNFQIDSNLNNTLTQNASAIFAADAQANDTYVITLSPALIAYQTGQVFYFSANTGNTGAATLNINGLGAKTIKKNVSLDLETGDIRATQIQAVIYDGTNFQLISQVTGLINQNGQAIFNTTTGSANAYVLTLSPVPIAYTAGMIIGFVSNFTNTAASTVNVNGLGAKTIKKNISLDLIAGDITSGQSVRAMYDGTNFQIISPWNNVPTISSPTAYTVMCAGTTSTGALQSVAAVGSSGQVLTSNGAAALPTFQTGPTGATFVLIQTNTSSSSAISEFNALFSSSYDQYFFVFSNVLPATDGAFFATQLGTGGTPTYVTTGYKWNAFQGVNTGGYQSYGSIDGTGTFGSVSADQVYGVDNAEGGICGTFNLRVTSGSSAIGMGFGDITYVQSASTSFYVRTMCGFKVPAATFTAIKFYFSTGNIASGKIAMYGIKNS